MASVRAIVPGQITNEQLFQPLAAALERYPEGSYEIIVGAADKVDPGARTVLVSPAGGGAPRTLGYDQLVVATGSRPTTAAAAASAAVPWKVLDTYGETVASLEATRLRVERARHIVVAGAGATGVEVAGELGFEYGAGAAAKEVHLLSGGPDLLGGDSVGAAALAELRRLHVQVRCGARVAGTRGLPDGRTEVALEGGETVVTDLYLPTMGLRPNSEMLGPEYLGEMGYVNVDEYYRLEGPGSDGVWALGDVVSKPRAGFLYTQKQVCFLPPPPPPNPLLSLCVCVTDTSCQAAGVAKNVELALQGKQPQKVKLMPVEIVACSVGRSRGAGRMGPVKMLSLMVWLAKGKTLGIQRMPGYIDGSVA